MVKIWCAGSVSLRYMLTIDSAKEFEGSFADDADSEEKDSKRRLFDNSSSFALKA